MGNLFYTSYHVDVDDFAKTIDLYFPESSGDTQTALYDFVDYSKYDTSHAYPINIEWLKDLIEENEEDKDMDNWRVDIAKKMVYVTEKYLPNISYFYIDF